MIGDSSGIGAFDATAFERPLALILAAPDTGRRSRDRCLHRITDPLGHGGILTHFTGNDASARAGCRLPRDSSKGIGQYLGAIDSTVRVGCDCLRAWRVNAFRNAHESQDDRISYEPHPDAFEAEGCGHNGCGREGLSLSIKAGDEGVQFQSLWTVANARDQMTRRAEPR